MCDECCEWLEQTINKTKPVTKQAFDAFWLVILAALPNLDKEDFNNWNNCYDNLEEDVGLMVANYLTDKELQLRTLKVNE